MDEYLVNHNIMFNLPCEEQIPVTQTEQIPVTQIEDNPEEISRSSQDRMARQRIETADESTYLYKKIKQIVTVVFCKKNRDYSPVTLKEKKSQ